MMSRKIKHLFAIFASVLLFASCSKVTSEDATPTDTNQTIFMYLPWSGNLTSDFYRNLENMKKSMIERASVNERVVCFFATSADKATLFELRYKDGGIEQTEHKSYNQGLFSTPEGISSLLGEVRHFAPSDRYAMIIGGHGTGWLPVTRTRLRESVASSKMHYEYLQDGKPLTRYFGAFDPEDQTDVVDLARGLELSGLHMEFILLDLCYMSNIETAYDLRGVTDYIIACPTEVMADGFPYHKIGTHLLGYVDYQSIVNEFYNYYNESSYPYGTVSVCDTRYLDQMATLMREINTTYIPSGIGQSSSIDKSNIQIMDGYNPVIFYDFGSYISELCEGTTHEQQFNDLLQNLVPFKAHTEFFPTALSGWGITAIKINTYSGLTISDISDNSLAATSKENTAWWIATH